MIMHPLSDYLAKHKKKYLIFDFDETLFYLKLPWQIFIEKHHDYFAEIDRNLLEQLGKDHHVLGMTNIFVSRYGKDALKECLEWAEQFERDYLEKVVENKELTHFVKTASKDYRCFVWSSNFTSTITPVLENNNMHKDFELIVGRDKVRYMKPEPDGFALIKKHFKSQGIPTNAKDFLMIGNSLSSDKGAADNAAIDFFHIDFFGKR